MTNFVIKKNKRDNFKQTKEGKKQILHGIDG